MSLLKFFYSKLWGFWIKTLGAKLQIEANNYDWKNPDGAWDLEKITSSWLRFIIAVIRLCYLTFGVFRQYPSQHQNGKSVRELFFSHPPLTAEPWFPPLDVLAMHWHVKESPKITYTALVWDGSSLILSISITMPISTDNFRISFVYLVFLARHS